MIEKDEHVNLNNIPLSEFKPGMTLYIQKIFNDFSYIYYCEFLCIKRGIVHAKVLAIGQPYESYYKIGETISAIPKSCYLWGRKIDDKRKWNYCNWFKDTKSPAGV